MYSGCLSVESVAEICFPHLPRLGKISTWVWAGFKAPSLSPCRLGCSCQTLQPDNQPSLSSTCCLGDQWNHRCTSASPLSPVERGRVVLAGRWAGAIPGRRAGAGEWCTSVSDVVLQACWWLIEGRWKTGGGSYEWSHGECIWITPHPGWKRHAGPMAPPTVWKTQTHTHKCEIKLLPPTVWQLLACRPV